MNDGATLNNAAIFVRDSLAAFRLHTHAELAGAGCLPLAGLTCGIKDLYLIAGTHTGCGHPVWLETHAVQTAASKALTRLGTARHAAIRP